MCNVYSFEELAHKTLLEELLWTTGDILSTPVRNHKYIGVDSPWASLSNA